MKKICLFLSVTCILIINSCESIVEDPNLPYHEQLVIKAILKEGKSIDDIKITRTLPPLDQYVYEKALVKNAVAYIKAEGKEYPLIYDEQSTTYHVDGLLPERGKTYYLDVKWKDLHSSSVTIIPEPPEINSFNYEIQNTYENNFYLTLFGRLYPKGDGLFTFHESNNLYFFDEPYISKNIRKDGFIDVEILFTSIERNDSTYVHNILNTLKFTVVSYDAAMYDYYLTQYEGNANDFLGTGGINVRGNIKNGIGLFIGYSTEIKSVVY